MKNNELNIEIGQRLRNIRIKKNLTQEEMADRICVSCKHYGEVERGKSGFSLENWIRLSTAFHIDLNYLFAGQNTDKIEEDTNFYLIPQQTEDQKMLLQNIFELIEEYAELKK
ncbi:hypothetical protein C815_01661 [Firmicutes bacterium M10-2]|nr:hypothetical protein C815_01661 [Firmicutes bacterium M10-2]